MHELFFQGSQHGAHTNHCLMFWYLPACICGVQVRHPMRLICVCLWTAAVCRSIWLDPPLCWRRLQLCSRSSRQLRAKKGIWQPGWQASTVCRRQLQRSTGLCRWAGCLWYCLTHRL